MGGGVRFGIGRVFAPADFFVRILPHLAAFNDEQALIEK